MTLLTRILTPQGLHLSPINDGIRVHEDSTSIKGKSTGDSTDESNNNTDENTSNTKT